MFFIFYTFSYLFCCLVARVPEASFFEQNFILWHSVCHGTSSTHRDERPDGSKGSTIDFKRTYSRKYYDYAVRKVVNEVNFHKEVLKGKNRNTLKALKLKTKSMLASGLMIVSK